MINLGRHALIGHATLLAILLLKFSQPQAAKAQVIAPATDGTGTVVTQNRQSFDIRAGSLSADGNNLFHSFQTFQLTNGSTANFLANPSVQSIFARFNGNGAAFIDGRLQITGAQANLFLLNSSGVIFGPNATLNLPANLTVTTGHRIGFNDGEFKAVGNNSYDALVGRPTAFIFNQPGTIRNEGDLVLPAGQSLTLLGGAVINTGILKAEDIQIIEVSGKQIIRVSQMGSLLTLEFSGNAFQGSNGSLTSSMLPSLLTTNSVEQTNQIITRSDGQLLVTDSPLSMALAEGATSPTATNQMADRQTRDSTETSENAALDSQSSDNQVDETQTNRLSSPRPKVAHHVHRAVLNTANASAALEEVEELRSQEFSNYFGRDLGAKDLTLPEIQQLLTQVETQTGNQSVIVYVKTPKLATDLFEQTSTTLELLIFKSTGEPVSLLIPGVSQADLSQSV